MTTERMRKEVEGKVISDKMSKTIVVEVRTHVPHPKYKKVLMKKNKFYAHDEHEKAGLGDTVRIRESRPMSRLKRWSLVEILRKGSTDDQEGIFVRTKSRAGKSEDEVVATGGAA